MTTGMTEAQRNDLELLVQAKPFLAHCLNLNHEINNPLAGIIGYAEYMLGDDEPLTKDQRHYVEQIMMCAERIRALIVTLSERKSNLAERFDLAAMLESFNNPGE